MQAIATFSESRAAFRIWALPSGRSSGPPAEPELRHAGTKGNWNASGITFDTMVLIVKKHTSRTKLKGLLKASQRRKAQGFDAKRFNGALPLKGDPLKVQRKLRDEWG
ncbi:MAG TPA: hypothetical protein PLL18_07290 [Flavobacteriales bacterium]|nr:hypothetical protein [Flavobacteriales bacterium]